MDNKAVTLCMFFSHALIFSMLLLFHARKHEAKSSYWLSFFIFLCGLYIAPFMFGYSGWYAKKTTRDVLFFIPFQQLFLLPLILYFYVKSLLLPNWNFSKKDWLHLLPGAAYLIFSVFVWVTDCFVLDEYYFYADGRDKDFDSWYQITGFISLLLYLISSLQLYLNYRRNIYETVSYADSMLMVWLPRFLIALSGLLMIRVFFFILNPEWANFGQKYWYYVAFSILFYYISISGYIHAIKLTLPFNKPMHRPVIKSDLSSQHISTRDAEQIYQSSTQEVDEDIKQQILKAVEEQKVFTQSDLTLYDVAKLVSANSKNVSNAINQGFNMNFNDFINSYRVKEVIAKIHVNEADTKTLLGIAYDCGFNSKSTFNRAFKKHTGMTPKEYLIKSAMQ